MLPCVSLIGLFLVWVPGYPGTAVSLHVNFVCNADADNSNNNNRNLRVIGNSTAYQLC